jgi:23S rRNA U2552 (ribose-2'-O)-methylase RlmE/FtsJ
MKINGIFLSELVSSDIEFAENIPHSFVKVPIILTPLESNKSREERMDIIRVKVNKYRERTSAHGYISHIFNVMDPGYGEVLSDGFVKYIVPIECHILNLVKGGILVGCTLENIGSGMIFKYKNIAIIHVKNPPAYVPKDIRHFKCNIKILDFTYELDKSNYEMKLKIPNENSFKYINLRLRKILYKKDFSTLKNLMSRIMIARNDPKITDTVTVIQYNNTKLDIKLSTINTLNNFYHVYIIGEISSVYNIPDEIRYLDIPFSDANKLELKFVPKFMKMKNYKDISYNQLKKYIDEKIYVYETLNKKWELFYRYIINPYEMLKPPPNYRKYDPKLLLENNYLKEFVKDKPISRAYYKVPEILKKFIKLDPDKKIILKIFTMADAPGGWAQCFNDMFPKSQIITTSLKDKDAIKYHKKILEHKKIKIDLMAKGNGDLLNIVNLEYLIQHYGGTLDIVCSDGALEYGDPNISKEILHSKLFIVETLTAVLLQKFEGSMFMKFFRRDLPSTQQLFKILSKFYEKVYLYKPKSVRISNSETFLICVKFKGIDKGDRKIIRDFISKILTINKDEFLVDFGIKLKDSEKTLIEQYNNITYHIQIQTHAILYEMMKIYNIMEDREKNIFIQEQINLIKNYP